jgi:hypothetical protein
MRGRNPPTDAIVSYSHYVKYSSPLIPKGLAHRLLGMVQLRY